MPTIIFKENLWSSGLSIKHVRSKEITGKENTAVSLAISEVWLAQSLVRPGDTAKGEGIAMVKKTMYTHTTIHLGM